MNMTTLEAIQFLLDNPDEMIREKDSNALICYVKVTEGAVMTCDENGNFLCLFTLDKAKLKSHWEVVKKPPKEVAWQEALSVWIDGGTFYTESPNGSKAIYTGSKNNLADIGFVPICRREFRECKFYIEN